MFGISLVEAGLVPDRIVRAGIRHLLLDRLSEIEGRSPEEADAMQRAFRRERLVSPIALVPALANDQHYEVAPEFFQGVLGPRLKYSCGLWMSDVTTLAASEEAMLALSCERAQVEDGMRILDLGCGWGSLSLWLAEQYPNASILAVSNSKAQREFILGRCAAFGFDNVEVVTSDVNRFSPDRRFDRVMSIEMFEHVRNHDMLLARIADLLVPGGKLFVHHFSHRCRAYPYETGGEDDWMGRFFFTGGMMPSDDLLLHCQRDLRFEDKWCVGGEHYQRTSDAWLANQDRRKEELLPILAKVYGVDRAELWHQRWRLFFLACSELFGFRGGSEWWVTHVRMARPEAS